MSSQFDRLNAYARKLDIIDAHEHFYGEEEHIKRYLSFFDYFFSYVQWDMHSAGMPAYYLRRHPGDEGEAVEMFRKLEPYWQYVKHGSYARPVLSSLRKFHGVSDFTADSIIKIGDDLNKNNCKGNYDRVFSLCRIEKIINQSNDNAYTDSRFVRGTCHPSSVADDVRGYINENPTAGLEDYIQALREQFAGELDKGSRLVKFFPTDFIMPPNRENALSDFNTLAHNGQLPEDNSLTAFVQHTRLRLCGEAGVVAAVHTGVWNDVTRLSPKWLFTVVQAHPDTVFDIYHMGIPYVRECAFLAKNYQNVYINMCWSHCVSSEMARHAMHEYLDLIPVNKLMGFGGDLFTLPEQVWGQLDIALENLCRFFDERIQKGLIDAQESERILRLWLYDNPKRVYKI